MGSAPPVCILWFKTPAILKYVQVIFGQTNMVLLNACWLATILSRDLAIITTYCHNPFAISLQYLCHSDPKGALYAKLRHLVLRAPNFATQLYIALQLTKPSINQTAHTTCRSVPM